VSSIEWNPVESAVLLTGSFDRTAKVFDTRNPEAVATWTFATDVECLKWNPFEPHLFLASTEDGFVYAADTRKAGSTLFTLQAHDLAVSSLSFSHYVPGLMVTASIDKTIKVWDVYEGKPRFVATRELDRSALYTVEFSPDSPGVIAVGGMEKGVTTLEVFETAAGTRFISCPCKLGTNHGLPASVSDLHPVLPLPCPMMKENSELPFGALTITHLSQFA
jgi:periodic tryptophan protein 1